MRVFPVLYASLLHLTYSLLFWEYFSQVQPFPLVPLEQPYGHAIYKLYKFYAYTWDIMYSALFILK